MTKTTLISKVEMMTLSHEELCGFLKSENDVLAGRAYDELAGRAFEDQQRERARQHKVTTKYRAWA